jgi:hypothetical protein
MLQSQALLRTGLARRSFFTTAAKAQVAKATTTTATAPPSTASPDKKKKRLVVAVGGNALQRRGDRLTIENMMVCSYNTLCGILMCDLCFVVWRIKCPNESIFVPKTNVVDIFVH